MEPYAHAEGRVVDGKGAAVTNAKVTYHRDQSGMLVDVTEDHGISEGTISTDKTGHYAADVHPGIYDVCVMADLFTPQCRKIEIRAERPVFPRFRLQADPIVAKHIRDELGALKVSSK
jgi:protocatechuate 3,4-dioxygenase beta subunit